MKIKHHPVFDTKAVAAHYTEQDGVPVKYVCTSEINTSDVPMDIFYRATPHPEFGNYYFGMYFDHRKDCAMITNADAIETKEFAMVDVDGEWHYSQSHHDYKQFKDKDGNHKAIDGGRQYARGWGYEFFKVKKGRIVREK